MKYFDIMGFTEKFVFRGEEGGFHAAGLMGRAVFGVNTFYNSL